MRRPPDFVIGPKHDPYLRRWWIIPPNRWFNIYLHNIRHSDQDKALHDHPWVNCSIVLRGGYFEVFPRKGTAWGVDCKWRGAGSVVFRRAKAAHRIIVSPRRGSTWTLFITGPVIREWGFHCPKGWVHWRDFVDDRDSGQVGAGCGEHSSPAISHQGVEAA